MRRYRDFSKNRKRTPTMRKSHLDEWNSILRTRELAFKKSILHNLQLCPTQFISNLYHNKDHKRDHMFKTCLVNLSTWISELKCNFKRYMTSLHLAKMHTKPKQFTLKSDLREIAVFLYSTLVHWLKIYLGLAMFCLLAILILVNIYFSPSMLYGSSKARFLVKNQL